ncbi:MAG TPA: O-antigen ligase family protein [Candidatus Udaeobacter sp.]|nr:O-antigen ligase family protein [Candidatus Udaeobacter sp.]
MLYILLVIYILLFSILAWKNFRWAVILFIVFLPTYLVRFDVFHFKNLTVPSTVLELSFGVLFLVWFLKYSRYDIKNILAAIKKYKIFFIAFGLFFLSSIVSVLISDLFFLSLGLWRAYFLEPMVLFLILIGRKNYIKTKDLILGLALSSLSISIYCIVQKFTGWGIATPEWTNEATRRVTAFFSSPNAVGLYLAPVLMLVSLVAISKKEKYRSSGFLVLLAAAILSLLAVVFTKSQGTWIGLGAGLLVVLFLLDYKKTAVTIAILGIIFSLLGPSMRRAVLWQDQAGQNRLRLLGYTQIFLTKSPTNFIFGTGLGEFFRKVQKPYYNDKIMERLIFPHNIFINFWTETGLVGMLVIIIMLGNIFYLANKIRQNNKLVGAGILGMLTVLVVHGLVDVPYFKNDLSFLFWILIVIVFVTYENICQSQTVGL